MSASSSSPVDMIREKNEANPVMVCIFNTYWIYIYICVCVCVCVYIHAPVEVFAPTVPDQ